MYFEYDIPSRSLVMMEFVPSSRKRHVSFNDDDAGSGVDLPDDMVGTMCIDDVDISMMVGWMDGWSPFCQTPQSDSTVISALDPRYSLV